MSTFTGAIEKWFEFCTIKYCKMANRCVFVMALLKVLTREALKGAHAWTLVALQWPKRPEAGLSWGGQGGEAWGV